MIDVQTHFVAVCPHCSTGLRIRRAYIGQQVQCNQCSQVFVAAEKDEPGGAVPGETRAVLVASASSEAARIVVNCPSCRATLSVRRAYLGQQVQCKQCDETFLVTEPRGNGAAGSSDNHTAAANGRDAHLEELGWLRGELERISAENLRLQSAHNGLQSAHGELQSAHNGLQSAHGELQSAHARLQAENAEIRAAHAGLLSAHDQRASEVGELKTAHDRIAAENERLVSDRDRLQAERDGLEADRDRIRDERKDLDLGVMELRAELAQLRAEDREVQVERDQLRADRDRLQAERDRLEVDLESIVDALGGIAPGEVRPLADERASLTAEVERLRGEVERLGVQLAASVDQRSALERSAIERQRHWEAELGGARAEVERLAGLAAGRDADLDAARAERDRLRAERDSAAEEVERHRATLGQVQRELTEIREHDRTEINQLRAHLDQIQSEMDRLRAEPAQNPAPGPDRDEECRAAMARVESLQRELADSRRLQNEMRGILAGIGIRFQEF